MYQRGRDIFYTVNRKYSFQLKYYLIQFFINFDDITLILMILIAFHILLTYRPTVKYNRTLIEKRHVSDILKNVLEKNKV